ncbi:MAG: class I SAM-dependent methyltransferase [Pseudomonadota bacterium]
MKGYDPVSTFVGDEAVRFHDVRGDEDECVAFLKARAGDGPALELAIGTGRIARPLAEAGVRVDGIDFAPEMVARLREKPGGGALDVKVDDFVAVDMPGPYRLIFIIWNSFFNVLSQDNQARCFENVAAKLTDGGRFIVEAFSPARFHRLDDGGQVEAEAVGADAVRIGVLRHDPATQIIEQNHVTLTTEGNRFTPVVQRYAWPSELDLMARLAGLELKERFGGWRGEPFDAASAFHVSVYGKRSGWP